MKTKRIVTFGCSNTFGQALPDVKDYLTPYSEPSRYAWPAVLQHFSKIDVLNLSVCGSSNKTIWRDVVDFPFEKHDTVIILWTFFHRTSILNADRTNPLRILPGYTFEKNKTPSLELRRLNKNYYKHFYNDVNLNLESWMAINHAKFYLDSLNIKNHNFTFELPRPNGEPTEPTYNDEAIPKWNNVNLKTIPFLKDFASDNEHPGKQAHTKFALEVAKQIKASSFR